MDLRPALWNLLSLGVFPLWLAAGAAERCEMRLRDGGGHGVAGGEAAQALVVHLRLSAKKKSFS